MLSRIRTIVFSMEIKALLAHESETNKISRNRALSLLEASFPARQIATVSYLW